MIPDKMYRPQMQALLKQKSYTLRNNALINTFQQHNIKT